MGNEVTKHMRTNALVGKWIGSSWAGLCWLFPFLLGCAHSAHEEASMKRGPMVAVELIFTPSSVTTGPARIVTVPPQPQSAIPSALWMKATTSDGKVVWQTSLNDPLRIQTGAGTHAKTVRVAQITRLVLVPIRPDLSLSVYPTRSDIPLPTATLQLGRLIQKACAELNPPAAVYECEHVLALQQVSSL